MDHRYSRLRLSALLALLAFAPALRAQEDAGYKPVEAQYLANNLSKFWATGLAFLDTVAQPVTKVQQKIGDKVYVRFDTKIAGPCYVDAALGSRLEQLKPGRDFVFTATVLHRKRGFFSFGGGPEYFVAVLDLQPALGGVAGLPDQLPGFALPTNSPDARVLANVDELLKGLQTEVAVLARERGIPAWELMEPGNTNRAAAELMVTRGVGSLASAMNVEAQDVLGQMLMALMAARVQPNQPTAPSSPVAAPIQTPQPPVAESPADVVVSKPGREPGPDAAPAADVSAPEIERAVVPAPPTAPAATPPTPATRAEKAALEKKARAEAEQAAEAKVALEKAAKAEQKRLAKEKAAQEELAREAAEKAAEEKAAAEKKAKAEQLRLERERLAQEKTAAAEKARLAEEQAEQELAAREAQAKAEKLRLANEEKARAAAARAEAQAVREEPKLRASTTVDAATGVTIPEPKAAQPSAKIQPKAPEAPTPAPSPAPDANDPNAPVPL